MADSRWYLNEQSKLKRKQTFLDIRMNKNNNFFSIVKLCKCGWEIIRVTGK